MDFLRTLRPLSLACCAGFALLPHTHAEAHQRGSALCYKWTAGQTLRYLVQQDPYFADPTTAIELTDLSAPYRPPSVKQLTEEVLSVSKDGAATLRLTLAPEPGFEEGVQEPIVQTITVTARGRLVSRASDSLAPGLLAAIFSLPETNRPAHGPLAVLTRDGLPCVAKNTTPSHDGLLLQTTQSRRGERVLFDTEAGILRRRVVTITGSLSLVMLRPAHRDAADFGRVVPSLPIFQTLTIEQQPNLAPRCVPTPASLVSAAPRSKN